MSTSRFPHGAPRIVLGSHPTHAGAASDVKNYVRHGASLRAGQSILLASKARALLAGRLHVSESDVRAVAQPALGHRLILSYEGEAMDLDLIELVNTIVESAL